MDGQIRSDAFYKFKYPSKQQGFYYDYYVILEVSYTHKEIPIKMYETLAATREGVNIIGGGYFPTIVVMDDVIHYSSDHYHSDIVKIIQLDFELNKLPLLFVD
jgi:hypothetical protein